MFPLMLSGANEVAAAVTTASGQGALTLNTRTGSLRGAITNSDISNGSQVREAPAGKTGDVVLRLEATDTGYRVPAETVVLKT